MMAAGVGHHGGKPHKYQGFSGKQCDLEAVNLLRKHGSALIARSKPSTQKFLIEAASKYAPELLEGIDATTVHSV